MRVMGAAGKGAAGMLVSRIPEEWVARYQCPLPMKRLGFSKVAQLLHAMPHAVKVVTQGSSCMVYMADDANANAGHPTRATNPAPAPAVVEIAGGETAQHVRAWLRSRAERSGKSGLLASRIPSFWAEDYPSAGPLPLKQMGVSKLIKFLYTCTDILRMERPKLSDGGVSATELLVFPAGRVSRWSSHAAPPPPPPAAAVGGASSSSLDPALMVRQGTQTWVKAAALLPTGEAEAAETPAQLPASGQVSGGGAEARRIPGTERPAMRLRADVIEETYGKGFAMLAKMGYKHDDAKLARNTPISVVSKMDKKGLAASGEEKGAVGRGVNGKQHSETPGKDKVFVKEWLRAVLQSCLGEYGTMEPLAMSRIPDMWSHQFQGAQMSQVLVVVWCSKQSLLPTHKQSLPPTHKQSLLPTHASLVGPL